jgi:ribosomal protein S27E
LRKASKNRVERIYEKVFRNEKGEFAYISCFVCNQQTPLRKDVYGRPYIICISCNTVAYFKSPQSFSWIQEKVFYSKVQYTNII